MTRSRTLMAAAAVASLTIAAMSTGVAATDADIPAEPELTRVSMRISSGDGVREAIETTVNGVVVSRGDCWAPTIIELTDDRLAGDFTYCSDGEGFAGDRIESQTYRIVNDVGSWQGSTVQFLEDAEFGGPATVLLVGEGDYDGLYAWLDVSDWITGVDGAIFNWSPAAAPIPPMDG